MTNEKDIDHFINTDGLDTEREQTIGQHIGYRYDVNLVPDPRRVTPFLQKYIDTMGWRDLNWLEDVHMGYEDGHAAVFEDIQRHLANGSAHIGVEARKRLIQQQ